MRPRFAARRKIPAAARGLKEYLGDTVFCRTADKEHAAATLRDSEMLAVQHCVADHRPAFPKSFKDRGHIPSGVRAKQPWNILEESIGRLEGFGDAEDFGEEAGAFPSEASALPRNAEVLAGESADEQINGLSAPCGPLSDGASRSFLKLCPLPSCSSWCGTYSSNVVELLHSGESAGNNLSALLVSFNLPDHFESSCIVQSFPEATHTREQFPNLHLFRTCDPPNTPTVPKGLGKTSRFLND